MASLILSLGRFTSTMMATRLLGLHGARFDYPMKLPEIHRALMGVPLSREELTRLLESHPVVRRHVETSTPFYFLKGKAHTIQKR